MITESWTVVIIYGIYETRQNDHLCKDPLCMKIDTILSIGHLVMIHLVSFKLIQRQ